MARILADLPDDDLKWLDQRAAAQGKSRASVLREAVATYKAQSWDEIDALRAGFGLWARHGVGIDPHEHDRQRRAEWTRSWDDDYEEIRAESPDLFDDYDDRERAHYLALVKAAADKKNKA